MLKKISTIGYEIPGNSNLEIEFTSKKSLMDSDIILIAPALPYYERSVSGDGVYLGKPCYGETGSFKLKEDIKHWKKELNNALNVGKTVFLMLVSKEGFYVDTGDRTYSGSGRNRSTTINVTSSHNYELLPVEIGSLYSANGKEIFPMGNPLFANLFKDFSSYFEYEVYLENIEGAPIFVGKDKTKVLGAIYKVGSGHLIALPCIDYNRESFLKKGEGKKENDYYWTPEALQFGKKLISSLVGIDRGITQEAQKTPSPAWISDKDFILERELSIKKSIDFNCKKIIEVEEKNKELELELIQESQLKDLLFEQGKPLEVAVIEALKILGYKAENYDDGQLELDQVITSPEGIRYIGECEGKDNKDIDITKFRQLVESMSADFARDDVSEKAFGILFGNAERLIEPKLRTLDFTQKCKVGAAREKIALIKTVDLFKVVKYLKETPDMEFQKICREVIYSNLGSIIKFPDIPSKK